MPGGAFLLLLNKWRNAVVPAPSGSVDPQPGVIDLSVDLVATQPGVVLPLVDPIETQPVVFGGKAETVL